jgi:hypothetical protein
MSIKEPTPLEREILVFQDKVQRMLDNSINFYESMMRDEEALKKLLEHVGEIPNNQRARDEHKADT